MSGATTTSALHSAEMSERRRRHQERARLALVVRVALLLDERRHVLDGRGRCCFWRRRAAGGHCGRGRQVQAAPVDGPPSVVAVARRRDEVERRQRLALRVLGDVACAHVRRWILFAIVLSHRLDSRISCCVASFVIE